MLKIGMIGCGEWAQTVIKEINKSKYFHLQSIVCNSKKLPQTNNLTILSNFCRDAYRCSGRNTWRGRCSELPHSCWKECAGTGAAIGKTGWLLPCTD